MSPCDSPSNFTPRNGPPKFFEVSTVTAVTAVTAVTTITKDDESRLRRTLKILGGSFLGVILDAESFGASPGSPFLRFYILLSKKPSPPERYKTEGTP